ncbi:MAG: galactose mutarotase [Actinomycetes bacterium]|jgi:aldose 1-epimerase|nr:galactose mutarotase [Actinomycetes bacterium]
MAQIHERQFGTLPDGRAVRAFALRCGDVTLEVIAYGARVIGLTAPDRDGVCADIVLGRADLAGYLGADYQGACIGRFANRIGNALMPAGGAVYRLDRNDGAHNLHGGNEGFHQVLFEVESVRDGDAPAVCFSYVSPDGESYFPGTMRVEVTYSLLPPGDDEEAVTLRIDYRAICDEYCPFNPTNHAFFNLSGDAAHTVLDTMLEINAEYLTVVDTDLIPTGELADVGAVAGGAYDFRRCKAIGRDIMADDALLVACGGYDQNYCLNGEGFRQVAMAYEPNTGRVLEVYTDLPGLQLYTFNRGDTVRPGKQGEFYAPHSAFCLETQFWPDAPNHPGFPQCTLTPERPFTTRTEYRLGVG